MLSRVVSGPGHPSLRCIFSHVSYALFYNPTLKLQANVALRIVSGASLFGFDISIRVSNIQAISRGIFADSVVESMELEGNILDKADLMKMEGVDAFLARRERNKNKNLQGGGMLTLSVCGLD